MRTTSLGDSDVDGKVNVADLANLAGNFGATSGKFWINGDFDYNGNVNVADLADLAGNFGQTYGGGSAAMAMTAVTGGGEAAAVPEPAVIGAVCLGALALQRRPRRRTRGVQA